VSQLDIVARIRKHGGIQAIHVTPFTGKGRKVIGWQNVVVCHDGTRFGLSLAEEEILRTEGKIIGNEGTT
jgi:hypothetical protein